MRKVLGPALAATALALLAVAFFLSLRGIGTQAPAAQPPPPTVPLLTFPGTPPTITPGPLGTPWPHVETREPPPYEAVKGATPLPTLDADAPIGAIRRYSIGEVHPDFRNPESERLVKYAKVVLVGVVESVLPSRWNTLDGKRPPNLTQRIMSEQSLYIITPVVVKAEKYLKGEQVSSSFVLHLPGGRLGDDVIETSELMRLAVGNKVLAYSVPVPSEFVPRMGPVGGSPNIWILVNSFPVLGDGRIVVDERGDTYTTVERVADAIRRAN